MSLGTDTEQNTSRPSTNRPIGHVNDFHTDILSKRSREEMDTLIGNGGVYKEAYEKMVGEVLGLLTNTITVKVKVKRGQTPQQVLDGTGRTQYTNSTVVETMPLEGGDGEEEVEFVFFKVGRSLPDGEEEAERKKRGLVQDLAAQAQYNADNPDFATDHPNGDAPEVALQVAKKAGMNIAADEVITGYELSKISPEKRVTIVHHAKIFARVNPKEKFEIIQILGKRHSVMFLGEGINDAPALKSADVGMVVQEASDIAKETADIVLTKPDLGVIIQSIYLGRQIMSNIAKYILITLTGNFGSLYAISLTSVITPILPLLPTQVLLENILTDVPMVGLINSPISDREQRKPSRQNIREICFNAVIFGFAILIIQFLFYRMFSHLPTDLFRTLWLIEIILFEFTLIISLRTTDWFWKAAGLATNTTIFFILVVIFTVLLPYIPLLDTWFHLQPYNITYLIPIFLVITLGLVMIEIMKKFIFRDHTINRFRS